MAIEFGVFHNGATDLTIQAETPDSKPSASGDLRDMAVSFGRVLRDQVTQGVLAERLGYSYFFMTEHHFQPEGPEFSPSPLLVEAAIAARTERIRLGQATNILTQWHPIRIAEMAAMLDVISGGRLEFGIGRGYQPREVEVLGAPFGASVQDQERNRSYFEEAHDIIVRAWTEDSWSFDGAFFQIPPPYVAWDNPATNAYFAQHNRGATMADVVDDSRAAEGVPPRLRQISVFPRPVQKPYPQIWMPVTSPRSTAYIARHGVNGQLTAQRPALAKMLADQYMEMSAQLDWPDRLGLGEFRYGWDAARRRGLSYAPWVHIIPDGAPEAAAIERFDRALSVIWSLYGHFGFARALYDPGEPFDLAELIPGGLVRERGLAIVGSAESVTEQISRYVDHLGFDDFLLLAHFEAPGVSGVEVEEQMHMFAELVAPELRRRHGSAPEHPVGEWRVTDGERRSC